MVAVEENAGDAEVTGGAELGLALGLLWIGLVMAAPSFFVRPVCEIWTFYHHYKLASYRNWQVPHRF